MSDLLGGIARWVIEVVHSFGYFGVGFLTALAHLHLPVPTMLFLPLAGFLVGQGQFSFFGVLASATAGAVVASLILYALGIWFGEESLRRIIKRFERFKVLFVADLDKAGRAFERHGGKAILIAHLIPGVGALIAIPAGFRRMPILGRFIVCTVIGSALWNTAFIGLGWALGARWTLVEQYAPILQYAALAAAAVGILWFLGRRRKARGRTKRSNKAKSRDLEKDPGPPPDGQ